MDRKDRPVGREKHVGEGAAEVRKRGDGLESSTEGPVGEQRVYPEEGRPKRTAGGTGGFGTGGGGMPVSGGMLKYILLFLLIAAGIYFLYSMFKGGAPQQGGEEPGSTVYYDKGAYAVDKTVSELARDKRTVLKGNGNDTVTIMVYMCGTDLESRSGMATSDLQEMLNADIAGNVNIIVETGGASSWKNSVVNSRTNQRYRVTSEGLELIQNNLGRKSMVSPSTLSDFISYCRTSYPADRYALIMWDHGGGSISGYGYDENFPNDSMTLDEIGSALKNGGCSFDFVGFDACLMGTLETAMVLEPYSDYMIASEEVEPGKGWYYTGWISSLSRNTSIATTDLGKVLIDDYITDTKVNSPRDQATLSLIDLAELKGTVPKAFNSFAGSTGKLIDEEQYRKVSSARAGAKEFAASSEINQIDLVDFAENLGTDEAKSLAGVLRGCIKYNRTSSNITNANGVSIFFPYGRLAELTPMLKTYEEIGMDNTYSSCIKSFASVAAGGQVTSSGSGNLLETLLGGLSGGTQKPETGSDIVQTLLSEFLSKGDYSSITGTSGAGWLDTEKMKKSIAYYMENRFDSSKLAVTEKDGQRVLALSEDQWKLVQELEQNVWVDDGSGYIDLGLDNVFEYNKEGDLIMEYDGTWLALNGRIVSYYMLSDDRYGDTYSIKGRVPAMLNGQLADIIIVFDNDSPKGKVIGARIKYDPKTQTEAVAKGLIDIAAGDRIDFLCDYYTYDGQYKDTYYLGDQYTATGEWTIENLRISSGKYKMTYRITDVYNNKYWTPAITD